MILAIGRAGTTMASTAISHGMEVYVLVIMGVHVGIMLMEPVEALAL